MEALLAARADIEVEGPDGGKPVHKAAQCRVGQCAIWNTANMRNTN